MKQILFFFLLLLFSSCDNTTKTTLSSNIEALQSEKEALLEENAALKKQLNNCAYGNPNQDIQQIGRWLDVRPGSSGHILILFKNLKTNKIYLKDEYEDGSNIITEMRDFTEGGLKCYEAVENIQNEYYIIEKNGDLSMCGQSGKFGTALCY